jgi:hypothetical protein
MRILHRVVLAAAMVAAGTVVTAPQAAALAEPTAGDPCTTADLGRRWPQVETVGVEPTLTHFTAFFVTEGSTGSQQVTVQVMTVITVQVGRSAQITTGFAIKELINVQSILSYNVQKTTATTNNQQEVVTWNFLQPGYYGVYKGTKKVTGTYSGLNCTRVTTPSGSTQLQWVKRERDSHTTFSTLEQGAVRCEDAVPATSIMRKAQEALGCFGAAAAERATQPEPTEKPREEEGAVTADVPPGYTCDATTYRIGLGNGLYWYYPDSEITLRPYAGSLFRNRFGFRLCRGPGEGDLVEYVLMSAAGACLTLHEANLDTEASTFDDAGCRTVDDNQRWYVYRDATNPNTIGIQAKRNGFMLGQNRVADNEFVRLYSLGVENGAGTYYLEPLP